MLKSIPKRTRLLAKRRAQEIKTQLFSQASLFKFGIELSYSEQDEAVSIEYVDGITKYSYDINWILKNTDKATLLNNFIYLFDFVDESCRITLCFQLSELGVFERISLPERKDLHPETAVFINKNQAALLQLISYSKILISTDTSIEELVNWFFEEYIKNEFGIANYQADIPMGKYSYLDKCKLLAPEIERILRQYQLLVEDGYIDHDLIALETNAFSSSNTGSLLKQKYCYLESKDGNIASEYFYSDQCMLNYDSRTQKSYETFANRLSEHKLCQDDFEEYQKAELDWLEKKGYIQFNEEGFIVANVQKIVFLGEMFRNGYVCYNVYKDTNKDVLDEMISDGTLRIESSLFSKPEADYIDYHLNKRRYINGLDLRNKYAHGSHAGSVEDSGEKEHEMNYYQMLKVMICIVLKINDELCKKPDLSE